MFCQDMSSSATRFPVSAVFGSGGGCGPVLAQCFWPKLGAEVACASGLVVPMPLFGVEFVWLSGVWLNGSSALGRFLSYWTTVGLRAGSAVSWFGALV